MSTATTTTTTRFRVPRYWTEETPSGRVRARFRAADGTKVSKTFDYAYEADAWGHEAVRRAASAALDGAGEAVAIPTGAGSVAAIDALRGPVPTVREYVRVFLKARRGHLSKSTHDGYELQLRRGVLACPEIARMPLDKITREAVDSWVGGMLDDEVGRPTVNRRLKVFRIVVNYAIDNDVLLRDPTRKVKYLPTDVRTHRILDADEEEARLLDQCRTPEERAQVLLALDAGLRWGEVAGLPVSAIAGEYLNVWQVYDRGTRSLRPYPKGSRLRVVPMTARLREALAVVALLAQVRGPEALLFAKIVGGVERPLDPWNWRRDFWAGATHRAKLNNRAARFHFHDLRHTYGTRLAAAGVPRTEIKELLGHADEATTAIYIHAGTDGRRLELVRAALGE